jgi:excisionase family DNA binding protein
MDDDQVSIPELTGYISVKDAAKQLGISSKRIYSYIEKGRIRAVRVGSSIAVLVEDVEHFQRNMTGRPRKGPPAWHVPPADNLLRITRIMVQIRPGQRRAFLKRLDEIRRNGEHLFSGTSARYIAEDEDAEGQIEIELIWRGVKQEESQHQQELEAFKNALADVLDWTTARSRSSRILLHTSGQ